MSMTLLPWGDGADHRQRNGNATSAVNRAVNGPPASRSSRTSQGSGRHGEDKEASGFTVLLKFEGCSQVVCELAADGQADPASPVAGRNDRLEETPGHSCRNPGAFVADFAPQVSGFGVRQDDGNVSARGSRLEGVLNEVL